MGYFGRILEDGRIVMSSYDDIKKFFELNHIVGRKIVSIEPECLDYVISNIEDFYPFKEDNKVSCTIETDGFISLVFEDGFTAEIEVAGEGPIILGTNGFSKDQYPQNNGKAYLLNTMFRECIGKTIDEVQFERTDHRMIFPTYKGIDMSDQDDGINEIRIILEDGSQLVFSGWEDFFQLNYRNAEDEILRIDFRILLSELNEETKLKYGVVKPSDCPAFTTFLDKLTETLKDRNDRNEIDNIDIPFILSVLTQSIQNNPIRYSEFILDIDRYDDYYIEICDSQNNYNGICDVYVNLYRNNSDIDDDVECESDFSYVFSFEQNERYWGFCECRPSDADYREDKGCCGHGCDWSAPAFTFYKREKISHEEWDGDEHTYWDFEDSYYALDAEEAEKKRIREREEEIARLERDISDYQERLRLLKSYDEGK